jgi:hypothetical protein
MEKVFLAHLGDEEQQHRDDDRLERVRVDARPEAFDDYAVQPPILEHVGKDEQHDAPLGQFEQHHADSAVGEQGNGRQARVGAFPAQSDGQFQEEVIRVEHPRERVPQNEQRHHQPQRDDDQFTRAHVLLHPRARQPSVFLDQA